MRLLLDTHIWLWSLLESARLTRNVSTELKSARNELWLSPISVWEALILIRKKRVAIDAEPIKWIRDALAAVPIREAALTHEVAVQSSVIELANQDPADRFLVASAKVYELTLVTADERLLRSKGFAVLANRS